jgi:hypothetical protein
MTTHVSVISLTDGRQVCLSYGVPVAAFIPADASIWRGTYSPAQALRDKTGFCGGYVKTDRRWSVTTSRHANAFCGPNATTIPDDVFVRLIAPIEAKGR